MNKKKNSERSEAIKKVTYYRIVTLKCTTIPWEIKKKKCKLTKPTPCSLYPIFNDKKIN